jgi:hypothetical protein
LGKVGFYSLKKINGYNMQKTDKNTVMSKGMKILFTTLLLLIPFSASAEVFCIHNQTELQNALNTASINGANDTLKIVQGAELNEFKLPKEIGYLLKIETGYSSTCDERLEVPAKASNSSNKVKQYQINSSPQQNSTGPFPPEEVEPKVDTLSVDNMAKASDITVIGVPAYSWRHGCGPTAVGMVIGYWDNNGYEDLFNGSALTQTSEVSQSIASQGTKSSPRHYEDYSLPEDSYPYLISDKSGMPFGDEHTNDSIADFMYTSWSSKENYYGWSWSNHITSAFSKYVRFRNSSYLPLTKTYYFGSTLTWEVLTSEIDAQRPMVFLVDSSGSGTTDHFVTVVGYRIDGTTQYYGCLDTWAPYETIRWVRFRSMSSSNSWGVWGGFSFNLTSTTLIPTIHLLMTNE